MDTVQIEEKEISRRKQIGKTIAKSNNLKINVKSILELSTRTVQKILKRMWIDGKLKCSNCGWNKTMCDIHHIQGKKIENPDSHDNLTYICPNCHRLAHRNILKNFVTLTEQIGDNWIEYAYSIRIFKSDEENKLKKEIIEKNKILKENKIINRKLIVLNNNIDYSKFGWGIPLSKLFKISPQKTKIWVKNNMPEFYEQNCYSQTKY
jgi:hypothetical protein